MNPELRREIDKIAFAVEKEMNALLPTTTLEEKDLFDSMRYSALAKAKRIRSFLIVETAMLFGVNIHQALKVASAVEFVHAYSLIHDDLPCMDDADTRRGQPANHKKFGEATAVLAGDALIPLAFEVLSDHRSIPDAEIRSDLVHHLAKAIGARGMVGGQELDMIGEKRPLSYRTMTRMQDLKTGQMFIFSCLAGAILGKASNLEKKALYHFSQKFGRVFQITDDILDEIGDEKLVGKPLRKDRHKKKNTFVSMYGVENAKHEAQSLINKACGDLEVFGKNADMLKELAMYLLVRTH